MIQHVHDTVNTINLIGARVEKIVYENAITIRPKIGIFRKTFQTSEIQVH